MLRLSTIIVIIFVTRGTFATSKRCGENEVWSHCVNRVCEYRKCSEVGGPIECVRIDRKHCKKGCMCKDNYLRADNGTCIPATQCPNSCICTKANEYYDPCPPECPSRTCASIYSSVPCLPPLQAGDPKCPPPECRCNPGYYRNSDGDCVVWTLCKQCKENERVTSCIQARCERRDCSDLNKPVICVKIDPAFCTVGCLCEEGYLRAANGTCIPVNQCPQAQCGDNEVFDPCPPGCPGEKCSDDPSLVLCLPIIIKPGDPSCQPACRCCNGYRRNTNGKCIPQNQCPPTCGVNEVYDPCLPSCPSRRCDDTNTVCPRHPKNTACTAGCRCADGFCLNNENVCVRKSECPPTCGPNEVYNCTNQCPPQRCDVDPRTVLCPLVQKCEPGCRCADNLVRNKYGFCVPRSECETGPVPKPGKPKRPVVPQPKYA